MNDALRSRLAAQSAPFLAYLEQCPLDDAWLMPQCWQTFDDDKGRKNIDLAKHWMDDLDRAAPELERLNQGGAGIFLTVNATDGKGRKKANITALRGWHGDVDFKDAAPELRDVDELIAALPLRPTMAVRTPGGVHLYWLAHEPMPCDEARRNEHEAELRGIVAVLKPFGADNQSATVERVLRVPGFDHRKAEPRPITLLFTDGPRWSREDMIRAFPPQARQAKVEPKAPPQAPIFRPIGDLDRRVKNYLDALPPAIQGQNGSGALFNAALKILDGFNLTEAQAMDYLSVYYNPRCVPEWNHREIQKKVHDAVEKCRRRGHLLQEGRRPASIGGAR